MQTARCANIDGGMDNPGKSISQRSKGTAGRKAGILVFIFFFLFGAGLSYPLFLKPLREMLDSRNWPPAACTVLSSQVKTHHGDETTYSIDIEYSYRVGGTEYRSRRYDAFGGSSSGYQGKQQVVDRYPAGSRFTCYHNPANPAQALIKPGLTWKILLGLIPVVFMLAGLAGVFAMRRRLKAAPPAGQTAGSICAAPLITASEDLVLEPVLHPSVKLGCALAAAAVLTGILGVVYSDQLLSGRPDYWLLLNPFIFLDAALIVVGLPYFYLATLNPKPTLTISPGTPRLGQDFSVSWRFSGSVRRLERLTIKLTATEEARYRRGTDTCTDRSIFYEQVIKDTTMSPEFGAGTADARVPAESMHSWPLAKDFSREALEIIKKRGRVIPGDDRLNSVFQGCRTNNRIVWRLALHAKIRMWPDVMETFEIPIYTGIINK